MRLLPTLFRHASADGNDHDTGTPFVARDALTIASFLRLCIVVIAAAYTLTTPQGASAQGSRSIARGVFEVNLNWAPGSTQNNLIPFLGHRANFKVTDVTVASGTVMIDATTNATVRPAASPASTRGAQ